MSVGVFARRMTLLGAVLIAFALLASHASGAKAVQSAGPPGTAVFEWGTDGYDTDRE